jgi:hypothetical protein
MAIPGAIKKIKILNNKARGSNIALSKSAHSSVAQLVRASDC